MEVSFECYDQGSPSTVESEEQRTNELRNSENAGVSVVINKQDDNSVGGVASQNVALVQLHSGGWVFYSIVCLSTVTAFCSAWMVWQFEASPLSDGVTSVSNESMLPIPTYNSMCAKHEKDGKSFGLWERLIALQIHVITNLIHAALLGGLAFVLRYNGDVIWLFFLQNTCIYWTGVATYYLVADFSSHYFDYSHNLPLSMFALLSFLVVFRHNRTCQKLREIQLTNGTNNVASDVLYHGANLLLLMSFVYNATTLWQWLSLHDKSLEEHCDNSIVDQRTTALSHSMLPFVAAYSKASHVSFLLAIVQQASIYPNAEGCVGGAVVASAWRSGVGVASLMHLVVHWDKKSGSLALQSMMFTTVETIIVICTFLASGTLLYWQRKSAAYTQGFQKSDDQSKKAATQHYDFSITSDSDPCDLFQKALVSSDMIAVSDRHSRQQRLGARAMSVGSKALFAGMTLECGIALSQTAVGSKESHEIYKWGMHAGIMYLFCTVMAVETPIVYRHARPLLILACPTGSLIALWQLMQLWKWQSERKEGSFNYWVLISALLFLWRFVCGMVQTVGVVILNHTVCSSTHAVGGRRIDDFADFNTRRERARFVCTWIFLPALAAYIVTCVFYGDSCSASMVATDLVSDTDVDCPSHSRTLSLAQDWPGLDLFFHFGMVLMLFVHDGLRPGESAYRPSLRIATVTAGHASVLILIDLLWDIVQSDEWKSLSSSAIFLRLLLFGCMGAFGFLWYVLNEYSKKKFEISLSSSPTSR